MMDFGPLWVWHHLKKLRNQVIALRAIVGYLQTTIINTHTGAGAIIIRDAPSDPEPNPTDTAVNAYLIFRNGSPARVWDATNQIWMV